MITSTSKQALVAVGVLGILFGGCKGHGVGSSDAAAASKPQVSTSTGTGNHTVTATSAKTTATQRTEETDVRLPNTATGTSVSSGWTQAASGTWTGTFTSVSTVPSASTATGRGISSVPGSGYATGLLTANTSGTVTKTTTFICYPVGATTATTGTTTGATTGTATTVCATWDTVKLSRRNGLGSCPRPNTASSITIRRSDDGSLILSGNAYRSEPATDAACSGLYSDLCLMTRAFPETRLTLVQRDQLMSLISAMPPGSCPHDGYCDPCLITTLSIDGTSDEDYQGCCKDPTGPGTHRDAARAIVAFIDNLVPGSASTTVDASAADVVALERQAGPCDIYGAANMPCAAAYSTIRALSKSYNGPLFQVRAGSTSYNNTMSGGTTKDIMPGPDGLVDVAVVDEACGSTGYCTVSVLYDHSGNGNHLKRAPKGSTAGGASGALDDYESIATKGRVLAGGRQVYALYMNKVEGYRTQVGVVGTGMPTGSQPQGLYMLADGTRKGTACCWEFGNVTTKPATEWAFADALDFGISWAKGAGEGPWYMFEFGGGVWAGGTRDGDRGTTNESSYGVADPPLPKGNLSNPSLDKSKFALGFLKVTPTEYSIRVADISTAKEVVTAYRGGVPITVDHKGGIVLGVGVDNANNSWGTFYEGAIVGGYPKDDVELSIMKNVQAMGYAPVP